MHRVANDPYLDWSLLVLISVVFSGIVIGIGIISYGWTQDRLEAPSTMDNSAKQALFDVEAMSRVLDNFDDRSVERANLRKGYTGVADPSL